MKKEDHTWVAHVTVRQASKLNVYAGVASGGNFITTSLFTATIVMIVQHRELGKSEAVRATGLHNEVHQT